MLLIFQTILKYRYRSLKYVTQSMSFPEEPGNLKILSQNSLSDKHRDFLGIQLQLWPLSRTGDNYFPSTFWVEMFFASIRQVIRFPPVFSTPKGQLLCCHTSFIIWNPQIHHLVITHLNHRRPNYSSTHYLLLWPNVQKKYISHEKQSMHVRTHVRAHTHIHTPPFPYPWLLFYLHSVLPVDQSLLWPSSPNTKP